MDGGREKGRQLDRAEQDLLRLDPAWREGGVDVLENMFWATTSREAE